ncbi:unnamed protein product [Adineta steineri]|uniref:Uncharacterized protein n=1 Tax=Adineta steineri TaxID=433720 RepID=A0A818TUC4_9BILA|nr:unnamed protein product [Adineta steineri]
MMMTTTGKESITLMSTTATTEPSTTTTEPTTTITEPSTTTTTTEPSTTSTSEPGSTAIEAANCTTCMVTAMDYGGNTRHDTCATACPDYGYGIYFSDSHAFPTADTTTCSITTDPTSCLYNIPESGDTTGGAVYCDAPNNNYYCCCR